ncbi:GNAT family N-acetyltransferase [Lachnospiraceae bacterium YH-ros2228]
MKDTFETKRLLLRRWSEADAEDLYQLASNPAVGPEAGWPPHKSVDDSRGIIRDVLCKKGTYAVLQKEDDRIVGSVGLKFGIDSVSAKADEPELGYWIGQEFWGRGYAPEASAVLISYAFTELHCPRVWCCHYEGNEKSRRVMEDKLDFRYVRTNPLGETLLGYTRPERILVLEEGEWLREIDEEGNLAENL